MCLSLPHTLLPPSTTLCKLILARVGLYILPSGTLSFVFPVVAAATACSSLSHILAIRISIKTRL